MRIKFLAVLFLFTNCWIYSQYRCPLKSGKIVSIKRSLYGHSEESILKIKSKSDKVFSVSNGRVTIVRNDYSIIVRDDNDQFYVYSNISKSNLKTNDKVKKNQLIAHAIQDEDEYYVLQFQFWENAEPKKVDLKCRDF